MLGICTRASSASNLSTSLPALALPFRHVLPKLPVLLAAFSASTFWHDSSV